MKVILGSRGSRLALTQTKLVIKELKKHFPNIDFQIKVIKTKGDKILNVSLDKIGDKGLFVKEIENSLLKGEIDIAIHSMKDMPSEVTKELKFSYVPKREDNRDVLILRDGLKTIDDIKKGGKIGTGSKRRKYQLIKYRPDIEVVPIRGNVETRINKIYKENLEGVILAAAGVKRLGLEEKISSYLSTDIMLPAPAQGALAIQIREDRTDLDEMLSYIKDKETTIQTKAERTFLKAVDGSCHIPIGANCIIKKDKLILDGLFGKEDGSNIVRKKVTGKIGQEEKLGLKLADLVLKEMEKNEG
ncbi:MAG: hydroxymethylbilane synthase [Firmicutes bacterium]|nr:hydroxymethylbilane synthase [Bacillota bacterium]